MQRRCLLTDAMGTLITLEPPAPRLKRELERRFAVAIRDDQAERAIAAEIRYYRSHMNEGRDERTLAELRRRCAGELRDALPDLSTVSEQALTDALLASLKFSVFDDARATLRAARRHGLRVVIVSNWDSSLSQVLERVGLGDTIDGVVSSASVGVGKPAPAIFEAALEVADAAAGEALHVGDSLSEDVAGARAAGITAVWLNRDGAAVPAGVTAIGSLQDLHFWRHGDP
jgi:putative hydrolase of the HAD superfamily